jgi:hypothetical protein
MRRETSSIRITDFGKKSLSLLFFLPLAVILATSITSASNYLLLVVIAGLIFFTILTDFKYALILIAVNSYFLSYLIWALGLPGPLINLGYFLIIMVLLREYFFTANLLPVRTPINWVLVGIIALGCLSIANGSSALYPSFKGLLRHVGFPLLFLLILMAEPDEKLMKKLVWGIILVAFLQVAASIYQFGYYTFISHKPPGMRADYSGGLLGYSCGGYTAVFMAMAFCIVIGFILVYGMRWYYLVGIIALALPIFLASARTGVFFFALGGLFMMLVAPLRKHAPFSKRLLISVALIVILSGVIVSGVAGESFKVLTDFNYLYEYSMKQADSGLGRLQAFDIVKSQLNNPITRLIGLGPGKLTPTSIVQDKSSLIAQNTQLFQNVTGYAYTTIEIGFLGLILFIILYLRVYGFTRRFMKQVDDPFWEAVSLGFCGAIIIYIVSTVYVDSWIFYPLPFTFWAIAAAIYRVGVIKGYFYI